MVDVGAERHAALHIGSDGGGNYFVEDLDAGGQILRVVEQAVTDGRIAGAVEVLAPDLDAFLDRLSANVRALLDGRSPAF